MTKAASAAIMFLLWLVMAAPAAAAAGDADIARLRDRIAAAIAGWSSEPDPATQALWRGEADAMLARWLAFRDGRCDSRLLARERRLAAEAARDAALGCRDAFAPMIVADLRHRYGLEPEGAARPSFDPEAEARPFYPDDPEAVDCVPPPPPECDYCAANACWERKLRQDDAELNALWRRVLASIAARPGLTAGAREDWTRRLRRSQRAWLALRDADCPLQQWETPNRFGHANFSMIVAPCLHAETRARMQWLARVYLNERPAVAT